jgi:hypothetical protein
MTPYQGNAVADDMQQQCQREYRLIGLVAASPNQFLDAQAYSSLRSTRD